MFSKFRKNDEPTALDKQIERVLLVMAKTDVTADDYPMLTKRLEALYELKEKTVREKVSPDTIVMVAGNLMLAFVVVAYEQKHVAASKVFNFIKPRT